MTEDPPPLSRSVEDYLKAIYALCEKGESASTSRIAESLEVQPASVSGMMRRLAESGFVEHAPYRGARLTPEGSRAALRIIRRHRILETYLSRRLGYSWEDVHAEAERLEHAASDELIERMAMTLEDPSHDPHGSPIPTREGDMEVIDHPTLAEVDEGERVRIRAVRDNDADRLRFLEARGLLPGTLLTVASRAPFQGPIRIRIGEGGETEETIGIELAEKIRVSPAAP